MEITYSVLIVEDVPSDAELTEREIKQVLTPCMFERVETEEDFLRALDEFKPDIIISDYKMPDFDGMTALKLTLERTPLTPFIILTGSMNENTAVECMKAGAWDYVIKEHIKRLGPAVISALEDKRLRQERKRSEEALLESEQKFRDLAEKSLVGIYLIQNEAFKYVNPKLAEIFEYTVEELIDKKSPRDLTVPEDWPIIEESLEKRISGEIKEAHYNFRGIKKNKDIIYLESYGVRTMYKGQTAVIGTMLDITKRKQMEEEIQKRVKELEEFYQMAIGRELRMIELKNEIEKLQNELKKYKKS